MNKQQEKVVVAMLCGLVITAAGALAIQPAIAASPGGVDVPRLTDVAPLGPIDFRNSGLAAPIVGAASTVAVPGL